MMRQITYTSLLLSILLFSGCTAPIDLNLQGMDSKYVVEGYVTTDSVYQFVKIKYSKNYLSDNNFVPISNAIVSVLEIEDNTTLNSFTYQYDSVLRMYVSQHPIAGVSGRVYKLQIKISDKEIVGEDMMGTKVFMDSLKFVLTKSSAFFGNSKSFLISGYAQEPGSSIGDAYMWDAEFKGILLTNKLGDKTIQNDEFVNGQYAPGLMVVKSSAFNNLYMAAGRDTFQQGDTVTVLTSKISNGFYKFLNEVLQSSKRGNSPYNGPPATPIGNIYLNGKRQDGVYGYFATKAISRMQVVFDSTKFTIKQK